ncbi:MAG: ABC transporter ATP-binding protein [Actinomycetales bacterium]
MSTPTRDPAAKRPDAGVAVLELDDVAVHFGGVKAVDGVSLRLDEGRIFGILGPNGSGKTTLLAAISRLVKLTRGRLFFEGVQFSRKPPHTVPARGIARTFQTVRLLQGRTVRENVLLGSDALPRSRRAGGQDVRSAVDEAIERTGLREVVNLRPDELSYGFQRRVEIARALAARPRLLLLDEPVAGMNKQERAEISALMGQLRDEGLTQLIIEHDVQMMVDTCDHLFAMNFGCLIGQGRPEDVVRDPVVQEAYLGKRATDAHDQ